MSEDSRRKKEKSTYQLYLKKKNTPPHRKAPDDFEPCTLHVEPCWGPGKATMELSWASQSQKRAKSIYHVRPLWSTLSVCWAMLGHVRAMLHRSGSGGSSPPPASKPLSLLCRFLSIFPHKSLVVSRIYSLFLLKFQLYIYSKYQWLQIFLWVCLLHQNHNYLLKI